MLTGANFKEYLMKCKVFLEEQMGKNPSRCLLFHEQDWRSERLHSALGFSWSDEEIDKAVESKSGLIGKKNGINCYVMKKIFGLF